MRPSRSFSYVYVFSRYSRSRCGWVVLLKGLFTMS